MLDQRLSLMYICINNFDKQGNRTMKTTTRSNRNLPSPLKFLFYLLAVTAFGVINWTLLKVRDPVQPETKSFESIIVTAMLEELDPVQIPEVQSVTSDINTFTFTGTSEQALELETWMFNYEAFCMVETDSDPSLEEWMINTSTWSAPELIASK